LRCGARGIGVAGVASRVVSVDPVVVSGERAEASIGVARGVGSNGDQW
jgi:hypothetical protein